MTDLCYPQPHVREGACEAAGHVSCARQQQTDPVRVALRVALELLEANEWRPAANMAGGTTNFCPSCGGTPGVHLNNPTTARTDGHWKDGIYHGQRLPAGGCLTAQVLDILRNALALAEEVERG